MKAKKTKPIDELLQVMATLRGPGGCPWDREQDHRSIRFHAIEEVYEMVDAIESGDDVELEEELGDLLLQVVFHCQLAKERGAFDFNAVAQNIVAKLIRRHPHVFGDSKARDVEAVWAQWEQIKRAEKTGTSRDRTSALDGIPKHLPALLKAQKLVKKASKAGLLRPARSRKVTKKKLARSLFELAEAAQANGFSAEELLRAEIGRREKSLRKQEKAMIANTKWKRRLAVSG